MRASTTGNWTEEASDGRADCGGTQGSRSVPAAAVADSGAARPLGVVGMTAGALCLGGVPGSDVVAPQAVLPAGHRSGMIGVHAGGRVALEVVEFEPVRDGPVLAFVGVDVRCDHGPTVPDMEPAVVVRRGVPRSDPDVTPRQRVEDPLRVEQLIPRRKPPASLRRWRRPGGREVPGLLPSLVVPAAESPGHNLAFAAVGTERSGHARQ